MIYSIIDPENVWFKREPDEPKIYKESTLYYRILQIFKDAGYDVIRQIPAKDGHLTSAPYYIRDRKRRFCWFDEHHQIRKLNEDFNEGKTIRFVYYKT